MQPSLSKVGPVTLDKGRPHRVDELEVAWRNNELLELHRVHISTRVGSDAQSGDFRGFPADFFKEFLNSERHFSPDDQPAVVRTDRLAVVGNTDLDVVVDRPIDLYPIGGELVG
eukprot:CAMPEP_0201536690 /NCGR_PEP_ID=MMETSP0161_2-20130828/62580_1 /ASSEMBLY_ACC=CAM_ASM_000251 /TAXON_ID=180227 /ORGANISM="Neoparamoeba aestuarina, Strain SoJaBio B1-5/56/2" /LENGTH=113 /DNA_ID=CAMNT_0047942537 /DNA_START=483 /DNA_END=824 /DNA_ORIENTATION=+